MSSVGAQGRRDFTTIILAQNIVIGGSPPIFLTIIVGAQNDEVNLKLLVDSAFNPFSVNASVVL